MKFGRGYYFAVNSSYAAKYSAAQTKEETKCVFMARVITGDFCVGDETMKAPPENLNSGKILQKYDSTVDKLKNPRMFVVFKDSSAYPSYLISYA